MHANAEQHYWPTQNSLRLPQGFLTGQILANRPQTMTFNAPLISLAARPHARRAVTFLRILTSQSKSNRNRAGERTRRNFNI